MKSIVVAYDRQRGIGAGGDLPWRRDLPADLARFRALTLGGAVVMGYNTYRSIGRPLAERDNYVVTSRRLPCGVASAGSLEEAYRRAGSEVCVIGGARLYAAALALDTIDLIYATEVGASFAGADTFFPELPPDWHERAREHHDPDGRNLYPYDFVEYIRA